MASRFTTGLERIRAAQLPHVKSFLNGDSRPLADENETAAMSRTLVRFAPVVRLLALAALWYLRPLPTIAGPSDGGEQHWPIKDIIASANSDSHLLAGSERISVDLRPAKLLDVEPDHSVTLSTICSNKQLNVRHAPLDLLYLASKRKTVAALHKGRMVRGCCADDAEPKD